jgi:hypothetical protein
VTPFLKVTAPEPLLLVKWYNGVEHRKLVVEVVRGGNYSEGH